MRTKTKFKRISVTEEVHKKLKEDRDHFQKIISGGNWSISDTIEEYYKIMRRPKPPKCWGENLTIKPGHCKEGMSSMAIRAANEFSKLVEETPNEGVIVFDEARDAALGKSRLALEFNKKFEKKMKELRKSYILGTIKVKNE